MANQNKDVLRYRDTEANLESTSPYNMKQKQLAFASDSHKLVFRDTDNTFYNYSPDGGDVVGGNLYTDQYVRHNGDNDTNIEFPAVDQMSLNVGGTTFLDMVEGTTDLATWGVDQLSQDDKRVYLGTGSDGYIEYDTGADELLIATAATATADIRITQFNATTGNVMIETAQTFTVDTGGSERLRIDSSGNAGLGIVDPNPLSATGTVLTIGSGFGATNPQVTFHADSDSITDTSVLGTMAWVAGATTPTQVANIQALVSGISENAADLVFKTATGGALSEQVRIDENGNMGIGTGATVDYLLTLKETATADQALLSLQGLGGSATGSVGILFGYSGASDYNKAGIFFDGVDGEARGSLVFCTSNATGTDTVTAAADARMTIDKLGDVIINEGLTVNPAFADNDTQIWGTTSGAPIIHVDAGLNRLGVITDAPESTVHIKSSAATFRLEDTDSAPAVILENSATTPSADTLIGTIGFNAENSTSTETVFARIRGYVGDGTNAAEDGYLTIATYWGGAEQERLKIYAEDTDDGAIIAARNNTATPTADTLVGSFAFEGKDSLGNFQSYAEMRGYVWDDTSGSEDGYFSFRTRQGGTLTEVMRLTEFGDVRIGNFSSPFDMELARSASDTILAVSSWSNTDTHSPELRLIKSGDSTIGGYTTGTVTDEQLGTVSAYGVRSGAAMKAAEIVFDQDGTGGTALNGRIEFRTSDATTESNLAMIIDSAQDVGIGTDTPDTKVDITDGSGLGHLTLSNDDAGGRVYQIGISDTAETSMVQAGGFFVYDKTGTDVIYSYEPTGATTTIGKNDELRILHGPRDVQIYNADLEFSGSGSGLNYGSMYQDNTAFSVTVSAIDTWYQVENFTEGPGNGVTYSDDGNGTSTEDGIIITDAGVYKVDYQCSFSSSGTNQDIELAISVNGTNQAHGSAHRLIGTGSDTGSASGTAILSLTASAEVGLVLRNRTSTNDITIDHAQVNLVNIGG